MKKWRNIFVGVLSLVSLGILSIGSTVDANVFLNTTPVKAEKPFSELNDNDAITVLPNGAFLHGEATLINNETQEVLAHYNSNIDANSITVKEAREHLDNPGPRTFSTYNNVGPLAANPSTQTWSLATGASYSSAPFSASGWRFAGYLFENANNSSGYLYWASYGDDGIVGTRQNALDTKSSGYFIGDLVSDGTSIYRTGKATYYTYSPNNGTYYYVTNPF